MRRLPVALAALLTLTLAVALDAAGLSSTRSAQAQEQTETVYVDTLGVDPDANGYATLEVRDAGFDAMWLQCAGAYPRAAPLSSPPRSSPASPCRCRSGCGSSTTRGSWSPTRSG